MHTHHRLKLRELPLPARLVLSVFLIAVGLGYLSAMVQLHFKEASPGEPMPTFADVVAHYAGSEWPPVVKAGGDDPAPAVPAEKPAAVPDNAKKVAGFKVKTLIQDRCVVCHSADGGQEPYFSDFEKLSKSIGTPADTGKIHKMITAPPEVKWGKQSMLRAFFDKSEEWKDKIKERPETEIRAERETERLALVSWLEAGAPEASYNQDAFALPVSLRDKPLTKEFKTEAPEIKIEVKAPVVAKKRSAKSRQVSVEGLTQSTHAHLLTFALLWAATGLIFAFTSYPYWIRLFLAPMVLFFQVVDISFWWLARLDAVGPYFAAGIFITGGVVGLGLILQILGSLLDMYSAKGKGLIFVLLLGGGTLIGAGYMTVVNPQLNAEKKEVLK
ncbi:hypothetical protein KIH39_14255 [Telmatocola sphagniphila]|uniref:Cytochrome c domain-containing protein n=1 Tax=Telmatocola sphagniphila TaxID=1123043 RepID=A0A8E6B1G8_9BACT|nr:hypothetical protein [Telmatocola sphagniphila]QVL30027.1 hypothetical protein KIH39_14255 [Telmatocola sphagniphila]